MLMFMFISMFVLMFPTCISPPSIFPLLSLSMLFQLSFLICLSPSI